MTTLHDRPNAALIVIDVQNGVVAQAVRRDEVVANIDTLVGKARAAGVPVIWVQDFDDNRPRGSETWQVVPELTQQADEPVVDKTFPDSFEATDLEDVLAERGVGQLYIAGAQTDECIRSTLHGAFTRGYDVTLVEDAHTTEDFSAYGAPPAEQVIVHTNMYWKYHTGPGRQAGTVTTAEASFTPGSAGR
jgi:nicotinamidase-related amidase